MQKKSYGFTFVELIIVLVILTILATIGFTVYESYLGTGRDTKRIADMRGVQQSLSSYGLTSRLPLPEDALEISSGTNTLSYHGDITDAIAKQVGFKGEIYDKEFNIYPIYVLSENRKDFQLMSFLEDKASMMASLPSSYAFVDYQQLFSTTIGKPLGVFLDDELSEPIHRMQEYSGDDSYDIMSGTGAFEIVMSDTKKFSTESGGNITQIIPNQSCKRILEMGKSQGNGEYIISPTGSGSVRVYCDMRTDGGGWTFIGHKDDNDNGNNFSFENDYGNYRLDRQDDDATYNITSNNLGHTEMMITLDTANPQIAIKDSKIVFYKYGVGTEAFYTGPIPCSGLDNSFSYKTTSSYSPGRSNACDSTRWYSRNSENNGYLTLVRDGSYGNYWGVAMGGDNSWGHDAWWYVR